MQWRQHVTPVSHPVRVDLTVDEIATELSISKGQVRRRFPSGCTREQLDAVLANPPVWLRRRQDRQTELEQKRSAQCAVRNLRRHRHSRP